MNLKLTLMLSVLAVFVTAAYVADPKAHSETGLLDLHLYESQKQNVHSVTIKGELSGFDCAVVGVLCPTTHRGADYTTGVFTDDETFYFVVNIPQSFLQQHFRQTVEIEGEIYDPYGHAVEPEVIHLIEDEERRLVYESGYFIDENGNRATFQNGIFRNGKWVVDNK